jgi:putative membrane protein
MKFVLWVAVNALALAFATWVVDGIRMTGPDQTLHLILVAVIFGLINAFIRPVVKLLSLPFILLTLGLLIFVINALMLVLAEWISQQLGLGFHVDSFWAAILGAIVFTVASWVLDLVLPDGDR